MKYLKNTSWLFAEKMLRIVAGLLVGVWVARYLEPEQFGVFSYALAFVALFAGLAKLGLDQIVVRNLVNDPDLRDEYLGTAFWLKVMGSIGMFIIIFLMTKLSSNNVTVNFYIYIIASGIIFQSFEVIDFYFQAKVLSKFISICKITQLLLSSVFKIYLIYRGSDLIAFVWVILFDQCSLALFMFVAYRYQKIDNFIYSFNTTIAIKMLSDSWPLILSGMAIMIYMKIDQIMIEKILGAKEVGIYSAAARISEAFYFIPAVISSSLFPAVVAAKKINASLYYIRMQRLYTLLIWTAILITIIVALSSSWLVATLYGAAYLGAGNVLMVHIIACIFVFFGCARGQWLIIEDMQAYGLVCTCIGAITNIVLNIFLIPKMGILGAAIATVISYGVSSIVISLFYVKDRVSVQMFFKSFKFSGIR